MGFFGALIFLAVVLALFALGNRLLSEHQQLKDQLAQARNQLNEVFVFLNGFSRKLGAVEEINDALQLVVHYLCDVLRAESLGIYAVDPHASSDAPRLRGAAVAGLFPVFASVGDIPEVVLARPQYRLDHFRTEIVEYGKELIGTVAATCEPILVRSVAASPYAGTLPGFVETVIAVPMTSEDRFLGVICAVNCREEGRCFDENDLLMLSELSCQAALACSLVQVYHERSGQERIMQELAFGRELQQSLLPAAVPTWGDYQLAAFGRPALEVAGDYYDFIEIDKDRLMVIAADATGKGVPACMLMAMCRSFARSMIEQYAGMEQFLMDLNRRLYCDTDSAHFVTMACVVINRQSHICEYGCAGHTPLLMRQHSGGILCFKPQGVALGLFPNDFGVSFETLTFSFDPGLDLLLFTDGITEALNERGEEFGLKRLETIWAGDERDPELLTATIVQEVKRFADKVPQADDQTVLVISRPEKVS